MLSGWMWRCGARVRGFRLSAASDQRPVSQVPGDGRGSRLDSRSNELTALMQLGFAAPLARGLFCLSRSVGILAHAWEQTEQGGRRCRAATHGPTTGRRADRYRFKIDATGRAL
jgi:hypothetical protein